MKTKNSRYKSIGFAALILSILISTSSFAAPKKQSTPPKFNYNSFMASQFQKDVLKIKKIDDIKASFLKTKVQRQTFDKWSAKTKNKNVNLTVKQNGTQIFLASKNKKATIDFKSADRNKIFINNVAIKLNDKKSFSDYETEVSKILNSKISFKSLLSYFFNESYAQEADDSFLASFIAWRNVGYSTRNVTVPWAESYISSVLRAAYEEEYSYIMSSNNNVAPGDREFTWRTLNFTCEGNRVSQVTPYYIVERNRPVARPINTPSLIRINNGYKFSFRDNQNNQCESTVDENGIVILKTGDVGAIAECPSEGKNLFEDVNYGFGEFPLAADLCCQRQGCYEEVMASRNQLRDRMLGTYRPSSESSDIPTGGTE